MTAAMAWRAADGVWRAGFAVLGWGLEDVVWIGTRVLQVVALHAKRAGDAAVDRAEGVRTRDTKGLAGVGCVKARLALVARVAALVRRGAGRARPTRSAAFCGCEAA